MPFLITQSASKVKTALGCSWKYKCSYLDNLPQRGNDGSKVGSCCHVILECLATDKRKKYVEKILNKEDIFAVKGVKHLAYKLVHKEQLEPEAAIEKIKSFVLNGLRSDFYGLKYGTPIATYTERDFLIERPEFYKIRGFIDRLFVYADGTILVRDYKSSKGVYSGHEASNENVQASDYSLAVREIIKEVPVTRIIVEFLFLKFDCTLESEWTKRIYRGRETKEWDHNGGGLITLTYSPEEISGFEYEAADYQRYLENFKEENAVENFAYDQGMPKPEEGFCKQLMCGRSTYPGQLKKDGTVMFACEFKYPFNYYHIFDAENKFTASCFIEDREKFEGKYPHDQFNWVEKNYLGCARFQKRS